MKVNLKPLADYVVAQTESAETRTASGIYLPEKAAEKPQIAKVLAIGQDVKWVKVGDRVVHKNYSSTDVKVGTDEFVLIKEEDILATVN